MDDVQQSGAWLEGHIAVAAALSSGNRAVERLLIQQDKWDRRLRRLQQQAEAAGVPVERVDRSVIEGHAGGQTHGGVLARIGPRRFLELPQLLETPAAPLVAMLDGIEDPFNFGQAVRALYAAGVDGLVLRERNWLSAAGVVARSSAGTSELIAAAQVESAEAAAAFFRERGLAVACLVKENAVSIYEADLTQPLFLLIGGEKRGITRSFEAQADLRLGIPYGRDFPHALGTAPATAVVAFEAYRQRRKPAAT